MRSLKLFLLFALPVSSLLASLPASTVWEVRTTGADTNGGCFVAGATGTDYTKQDAAQNSGTRLSVDSATNTIVSESNYNFALSDVGNCIHITSGTGWTAGYYQIVSTSGGSATLDRSPGATNITGGTWAEGGALATPQLAASSSTTSNTIWVQAGTYSETSALSLSIAGPAHNTTSTPLNRLIGYSSTRGDGGQFTLTMASGSGYAGINITGLGWIVQNAAVNCNSLVGSTGISSAVSGTVIRGSKVYGGCATGGISLLGAFAVAEYNDVSGVTGNYAVAVGLTSSSARIAFNFVHDNIGIGGVRLLGPATMRWNVVANNANADGILIAASSAIDVSNNTIYNSGRNGITVTTPTFDASMIRSNIISNSGLYGLVGSTAAGRPADPDWDGNAYYGNASGNRNFADDTTINPQYASGAYANPRDVILTSLPFSNVSANDFTLNSSVGGGQAAIGKATPGAIPGLPTQGYLDMGALQHQAVAGGGGGTSVTIGCPILQ